MDVDDQWIPLVTPRRFVRLKWSVWTTEYIAIVQTGVPAVPVPITIIVDIPFDRVLEKLGLIGCERLLRQLVLSNGFQDQHLGSEIGEKGELIGFHRAKVIGDWPLIEQVAIHYGDLT